MAKKRGRKSQSSISVISSNGIEALARPKAPDNLTDEQKEEWTAIVNRLPADWFARESHPVLAQYCRHAVTSYRVSQLIDQEEQSDEFTIDAYDQLLRIQARESNVLACLATKLRLTQQAKYTTKAAGTASNNAGLGPKPWEPLTNA